MADCTHFRFTDSTPRIREIGLGVAAVEYARMGYAVLPLVRGGKKPHRMLPFDPADSGKNGVYHASLSQVKADARWSIDPAANVGVATGQVSNLVVVDLDVKGSANGPAEFTRFLRANSLELPACPAVRTPSGGWHLWMRWWPGWAVPERPGILPGVDIKGDGGLVVAPPSAVLRQPLSRPGEREQDPVPVPYGWDGCPCQALQAPAWLGQWLASTPSSGHSRASAEAAAETSPDFEEARQSGFGQGERNDKLYRLACARYRVHGTSPDASLAVMAELREVYEAGDKSGMSWSEVLTIAQSARRFIQSAEQRDRELRAATQAWLER